MINNRQQKILEAIIREYVKESKPVSSKTLTQKYKLELSSATIRNEMKELGGKGYLSSPHISAGRFPTEKAYRLFIRNIEEKDIKIKPSKTTGWDLKYPEEMFQKMTKILAEKSGGLAFGGVKELKSFCQSGLSNLLKEPEFENKDYFSEIIGLIEEFDKCFEGLFEEISEDETRVFVGQENPLKKTKKLSLIISGCKIPEKKHGIIGLLGPIRMRYDYNISLVNRLKNLIENIYE